MKEPRMSEPEQRYFSDVDGVEERDDDTSGFSNKRTTVRSETLKMPSMIDRVASEVKEQKSEVLENPPRKP